MNTRTVLNTLGWLLTAASANSERNGRIVVSSAHELDEASIRMVWLAAGWLKNYDDHMGTRFKEDEIGPLLMLFPELHKFLEHKRTWRSTAGRLVRRGEDER
ncbi:MAG: hypothetical protein IH602_04185 [Bryobacteraceae bacterium]|nr:hypothetical protein [Bryobacteraceae bacterium]